MDNVIKDKHSATASTNTFSLEITQLSINNDAVKRYITLSQFNHKDPIGYGIIFLFQQYIDSVVFKHLHKRQQAINDNLVCLCVFVNHE